MDYAVTGFGEWNVPTVNAEDAATYYELRDELTADQKQTPEARQAAEIFPVFPADAIALLRGLRNA